MKKVSIIILLLLFAVLINAQDIDKAWEYVKNDQFSLAAKEFENAIVVAENDNDLAYAELCFYTAVCYNRSDSINKAVFYFTKCNRVCRSNPNGINESFYGTSLNNLALIYQSLEEYEKALPLQLESHEHAKQSLGNNHIEYCKSLNNLASLYESLGQYKNALPLYQEALEIVILNLGKNHPDYGEQLYYMATLYQSMREYEKALPLFIEALENAEIVLGKDHPLYGRSLNNLAILYQYMGQYEKALPLFQEALANDEKNLGKDDPEFGMTLNNLALLYQYIEEYDKALPLFNEAIKIAKEHLGIDHPYLSIFMNNSARLFIIMGQYENALPLYLEDLKSKQNTLGKDHIDYIMGLNKLAVLYIDMGQYDKALPLSVEAVDNAQKSLGEEHPDYNMLLNNLASIYDKLYQYEKALSLYIEVVDNTKKSLGEDHPDYNIFLNNLAGAYSKLDQNEKALLLYMETLERTEKTFGKNSPEYGRRLNNLASFYQTMKEYEKALPLLIESLQNAERSLGKNHRDYGMRLNNLATLYQRMEEYDKALPLYQEAIENAEKTLGETHPDYCMRLNNLATLYQKMEEYEKALPLYEKILEITLNTLGKEHPDYDLYTNNLTTLNLAMMMDQFNKEHPGLDPFFSLENEILEISENFSIALPSYLENLEKTEKTVGKYHPDYSMHLHNLANLYKSMGQYDKALPIYQETLEIRERVLGKDHQDYISTLYDLAVLYRFTGQYGNALTLYMEVLENSKNTDKEDGPFYSSLLNNMAIIYELLGQSEKARLLYLEAIENAEKDSTINHSAYSTYLNNLAEFYRKNKRYKEALPLYLKALDYTENALGRNHSYYGTRLNNLALLYHAMGQYDSALHLYNNALENIEKSLGKDHSYYGQGLNNLALLNWSIGQYETSLSLYLESLTIIERSVGKHHMEYSNCLNNLAGLYQSMGHDEKAAQLYIENTGILNHNINRNFAFLSEKEQDEYLKTVSQTFEEFNSFALEFKNIDLDITKCVFDNTLINKGILLKSSKAMRSAVLSSGDTLLTEKLNQWSDLNRQIARLYSTEKGKRIQDPKELEELASNIERELVNKSQEFSDYKNLQKINWKDIQKVLGPDEAVIEFIIFDYYNKKWTDSTRYCALILKHDSKQPDMIPLFEERQLKNYLINTKTNNDVSLVNQLYGEKRDIGTLTSFASVSYADSLYSLIWNPLDRLLEGIETVYYSPSGLLHTISFAAIPYNDSLLLSDKYDLVYLSSSANLVNPKSKSVDFIKANVALYGGLQYDATVDEILANAKQYQQSGTDELLAYNQRSISISDSSRGGSWNYLNGTLEESENINDLLNGEGVSTTLYQDKEGNEESFKSLAGSNSPEIIHLATHGFFFPDPEKEKPDNMAFISEDRKVFRDSDNPLIRSGIILSGANLAWNGEDVPEGIDDGILTAYEVSGMDLYNTQLVVLSACETGLGDIKGSEGVYGLQRSFKMAGVDYLIMSLWQVPDKETSEFMTLFYTQLLKTNNIRDAFAETQKTMRDKYDPYYWAAFVLIE
ncbi:tetratricopeptide repeat protein [Bacteroidota bacterium]